MAVVVLNNDIYIEIIKYCNFSTLLKLKKVNKLFQYYIKKHIIFSILKKYTKNIRCNLLYKSNNIHRYLISKQFDNVSYNDLFKKNINQICLPSMLNDLTVNHRYTGIFDTYILRTGDILQSLTIIGNNINKIELYIGNRIVYKCHYLNANLIHIQPFVNGIFLICLSYHEIKLKVYAVECNKIYGYYKFIVNGHVRCDISQNTHIIPYAF